jgi:hypothetical protein
MWGSTRSTTSPSRSRNQAQHGWHSVRPKAKESLFRVSKPSQSSGFDRRRPPRPCHEKPEITLWFGALPRSG